MQSSKQSGVALLIAMITLAIVVTLTGSALNMLLRAVEIESVERGRIQGQWLLRGALDWSKQILRRDLQNNRDHDHLSEIWSVPLHKTKISSFLSEDNLINDASTDINQAYLSGYIEDTQAKINLKNLSYEENNYFEKCIERLFEMLEIEPKEFLLLKNGLKKSTDTGLIMPIEMDDLLWLGISKESIEKLKPHATLLSNRVQLNINTASAEAIWAIAGDISYSDAKNIVRAREHKFFTSLERLSEVIGANRANMAYLSVRSNNFTNIGNIEIDGISVGIQASIFRSDRNVVVRTVTIN